MKIETVQMIECHSWDALVMETYGRIYSFQQQEGCRPRGIHRISIPNEETYDDEYNDSIPDEVNGEEMGVKFAKWLERDPNEWDGSSIDGDKLGKRLFWQRNFYPELQTIANDLHAKGLIPEGDYIINIDW